MQWARTAKTQTGMNTKYMEQSWRENALRAHNIEQTSTTGLSECCTSTSSSMSLNWHCQCLTEEISSCKSSGLFFPEHNKFEGLCQQINNIKPEVQVNLYHIAQLWNTDLQGIEFAEFINATRTDSDGLWDIWIWKAKTTKNMMVQKLILIYLLHPAHTNGKITQQQ